MTESTQDQISAFIDGELSADETEFLLRRLGHDSGARRHLRSYLAIGAAVRSDLIADRAVDLSGSVAQALDGTEDEAHGHGEARGWLRFVKPVIGVGILGFKLPRKGQVVGHSHGGKTVTFGSPRKLDEVQGVVHGGGAGKLHGGVSLTSCRRQ